MWHSMTELHTYIQYIYAYIYSKYFISNFAVVVVIIICFGIAGCFSVELEESCKFLEICMACPKYNKKLQAECIELIRSADDRYFIILHTNWHNATLRHTYIHIYTSTSLLRS